MIEELSRESFHRVAHIFGERKEYIPALAVIEGALPGRIFVDDSEHPTTALVWALSRWAYIDGDPDNRDFAGGLSELVESTVFPCSLEMGMNWFELYANGSDDWSSTIEGSLADFGPEKHYESASTLYIPTYRILRREPEVPAGLTLEICDLPLVSKTALRSPSIPAEWAERMSFGAQLRDQNRAIAICKSYGLTAGKEFMIDVETVSESERGKGYATLVSTVLIDFALEQGLKPLWETTEDNAASLRLAAKVGFVRKESYPVYDMTIPQPTEPDRQE